jgi:hypothetical protein
MSMPDWFLVAWWLLAAAVGIPMFILTRRSDHLDRQRAVLSYLKGIPRWWSPAWRGVQLPGPVPVALLVSVVSLAVGALVLLFIHDWTRLLVLNFQIFMIMFGGAVAKAGLSSRVFAKVSAVWVRAAPRLMRTLFTLLGVAIIATGSIAAIKDVALPRLVVEGHVDRVTTGRWRFFGDEYFVVIDGKRLRSTFEAFVHIHPARRVRVEIGAGSGMIFASEAQAREAARMPARN